MYIIISSSPRSSSSSAVPGTGEGVDRDGREEGGDGAGCWVFWFKPAVDALALLGASNLSPLDGESTEKR